MGITRSTFAKGVMDKDTDERLIPDGVFRHAENVLIAQSEGSDVGSIQNSYSNKQLTNYDFGEGVIETLGTYCDELEDKIYWFVKSDTGCYLMEYDAVNGITSPVLVDTRDEANRVLNLNSKFLITGAAKIISEDTNEDLFIWTDDNMQPCCINVERAKSWAVNGFVKEDIFLVKKPPRYAPTLTPTYVNDSANNMEEKFLSFCYRYKFRDGEYSALSTFTNYSFSPKPFELDYYSMDNLGMVNAFNAVRIEFNTGEKQVTDIQLCVKESNWNNIYVIETFNKYDKGWGDNKFYNYTFSNNKLHVVLPIKELFRAFDNVPLKAKALTLIGNRAVFGNYLEGRDMLDDNDNKVVIDYEVSLINKEIIQGNTFTRVTTDNKMTVTNDAEIELKKGNKITIFLNVQVNENFESYRGTFYHILPKDYDTLQDVFADQYFTDFIPVIDNDFRLNYQYDFPPNTAYVVEIEPVFSYSLVANVPTFSISPVTFKDTNNGDALVETPFKFVIDSAVLITSETNSTSIKTNRDYEVGFVYEDDFNRKTTVLTSLYNTIYVPQEYSEYRNSIRVAVNHKPPAWADRYKIVVKAKPLQYQTIYINRFYNEGFFVWCKLEAENKDKVLVGDTLIVKRQASQVLINPIKVKVLALEAKEKDWIDTGDDDKDGNPIIQEAGFYMKIRPDKFSMDFDDFDINQAKALGASLNDRPVAYLDLQTTFVTTPPSLPVRTEKKIPAGSSVYLRFDSSRNYAEGWKNNIYEATLYAQRDYDTLEEWFNENIMNRTLRGNVGEENEDYNGSLELVRGDWVGSAIWTRFIPDQAGKLFLKITGTYGGSGSGIWQPRYGRINAEIVIRTNTGFYVFETLPKQADAEIYYETEQTFDIVDGNHKGTTDQDVANLIPAIVELDFFNCYTQGDGIESYRVKDGFNTNYLNIDLRPSAASAEEYKAVRRYADLTYSEPFVESTNINGLNEFNLSTANYKELDKQFGSIQKLHSRDNDVLVLQEERASKVMFGKDALYNGDGTVNVTSISEVLGQNIPYIGESGIGKNPESFTFNNYQVFYANIRRGLILRLSIDGITEIVTGMVDWFRDLSITHPFSKKLGAYDPYLDHYVLSIDEQPPVLYNANCGNVLVRSNQTTSFSYNLQLNELIGNVVLNYNITSGEATISAVYNEITNAVENVTGTGTLTIPRTTLNADSVLVTITPISPEISFEISNACPVGTPMKIISVVLNDSADITKTITNRYRWNSSPFYAENDLFSATPISKWTTETGIEGVGRMPNRGATIRLESFKDSMATATFSKDKCNRLGYLVSSTLHTEASIDTLLSGATYLTVTEALEGLVNVTNSSSFVFNKTADNEILYLIWDYTDRKPIALNDSVYMNNGEAKIVNVLANDTVIGTPIVTIETAPIHGLAVVNGDNTITYTHDGTHNQPPPNNGVTRIYEYGVSPLVTGQGLVQGDPNIPYNSESFVATEQITVTLALGNNYQVTVEQPNFNMFVFVTINGAFYFAGTYTLNIGDVLSTGYQTTGEGTVDSGSSWLVYIDKNDSLNLASDTIVYNVSNGVCSTSATINVTIAAVIGGQPNPVPEAPVMTTYSYEGIWETNDPAHPSGGSLSYVDINGVTQNITSMWNGTCVPFDSQTPPTNKIGVSPCL
jgi:hypothetical protein